MTDSCVEDTILEFAHEDEQQLWEVVYDVAQRCFAGEREAALLPTQARVIDFVQAGLYAVSTWNYESGTIKFEKVTDRSAALGMVQELENWRYPPPNPVVCVYATEAGEAAARSRERGQ